MKVYYKFIKHENLLLQKATGVWSTKQYVNYVETVYQNEKMNDVKKIITDLRQIDLKRALDDVDFLIELREKIINLNYLSVVIINDPIATVVTHLYQRKVNKDGENTCTAPQCNKH